MGQCKDCRHWSGENPNHCTFPVDGTDQWRWCLRTINRYGINEAQRTKALAHDGEDYFAALLTAPDFGCVQFEPKD